MGQSRRTSVRFRELDGLRGLAALAVMLGHFAFSYQSAYGYDTPLPLASNVADADAYFFCRAPVMLFFMISGFVIFMTLERARDISDFLIARGARLFPAYWVSIAICLLVIWAGFLPHAGEGLTLYRTLANATMFHEFFGVRSIDPAYWSLTAELIFYALAALMIFQRSSTIQYRALAVWLLGCLAFPVIFPNMTAAPVLLGRLFQYANFFIAGVCFYKIFRRRPIWIDFALLAATPLPLLWLAPNWRHLLWIIPAYWGGFFLAIQGAAGWLASNLTVFLGRISYSLYLIHIPVGYSVIRLAQRGGLTSIEALTAGVAVSLGVAALMAFYIEEPGRRLGAVWGRRRRQPSLLGASHPEHRADNAEEKA